MNGVDSVLKHLNRVLANELVAIHQFFLHARMLRNWGFESLASHEDEEVADETGHADRLVQRILFLEGVPNMQDLGRLRIGADVEQLLRCDLALEMQAIPALRDAIADCEKLEDYVTRALFADILASEEQHVDWLETQLRLIGHIGIGNYLQSGM